MYRFLHTSDLHLGKRFGNFEGDLPVRLREARHAVLGRLAELAREHGAATILLAGDTFDTETPAPDIRRQALAEMGRHAGLRWVMLPGNHDSLQAAQLWAQLRAEAPENVTLATEAHPIALAPTVTLLPAPCTARRPGRDLTDWMNDVATPEGTIRLGLAHGAIQSFSEEGGASDIIAPTRARLSGLDYLALGDWHGPIAADPRTYYSGTPEPDRFKHDGPGAALMVVIEAPTAPPVVTSFRTESFSWATLPLHLMEADDAASGLAALLPSVGRRQRLIRVVATGRARLAALTALGAAIDHAQPEFAFLDLDAAGLSSECDARDLDAIDRAGALREAANVLLAEAEDPGLGAGEREIARAALARLFSYAQAVAP